MEPVNNASHSSSRFLVAIRVVRLQENQQSSPMWAFASTKIISPLSERPSTSHCGPRGGQNSSSAVVSCAAPTFLRNAASRYSAKSWAARPRAPRSCHQRYAQLSEHPTLPVWLRWSRAVKTRAWSQARGVVTISPKPFVEISYQWAATAKAMTNPASEGSVSSWRRVLCLQRVADSHRGGVLRAAALSSAAFASTWLSGTSR
jgi:hypothetical protein